MSIDKLADAHLRRIKEQIAFSQFVWCSLPTPDPEALRLYQGENAQYLINVAEASVAGGAVHQGMVVSKRDGLLIKLDRDFADTLWQAAVAVSN